MVAVGFQSAQPVFKLVAERAHRTIRTVRTGVAQVSAPEVVGQQVQPRGGRQDIGIAQDGASASDKWEIE